MLGMAYLLFSEGKTAEALGYVERVQRTVQQSAFSVLKNFFW